MIDKKAADALKTVPLSNNTVCRRIDDMGVDIVDQVVEKLKHSGSFALQLDESTDVNGEAQLIAFVRYRDISEINEHILFCKKLTGSTTGEDVFHIIDSFFSEHNLDWKSCTHVCTDGAASMTGRVKGLLAHIKKVNPDVEWNHCIIHREALASKRMSPELHDVLNDAVKAINLFSTPTLTVRPDASVWEGEAVTLQCGTQIYKQGTQLQYRYIKDNGTVRGAGSQDQHSIPAAELRDTGSYQCEVEAAGTGVKKRSDSVRLSVRDQWVILQTPLQPVIEGDSLTLRCRVRTNFTFTRIVFFKDNEEIQSQNNTELSVYRVSKSDEGSYKCRAMWDSSTYSGESAEVRVSVRELFSWVTLSASPGATVKEGEALNLTCEAAVNKTPRPELHYTIVRDGEPVTNSTDSALYSIASTEKSHTGSYTCAVESQGVRKSSQELHIEVQSKSRNFS
ncbi:UNVERIFIED_CONTAM: hypothetical protein FKN15_073970 [Acipenser sinensis]